MTEGGDIMSDFSDEQINTIITQYIKEKKYKADYYKNKYHNDPVHKEKCKERSRKNYIKRKEILKERYQQQKELTLFKKNYKYHVDRNMVEKFLVKYPELWEKYSHHIIN